MKTLFKRLGLTLLLLILAAGGLAAHEWYAKKPFFFRAFLDREVLKLAFESPETLTSLGFLENLGIKGHNAELDDESPAKADQLFAKVSQIRDVINQYPDSDLSSEDKLSKDIALYLLDSAKAAEPYRYHNYPVNQLFGAQSNFPSFMDGQHRVQNEEDAQYYLARLRAVDRKFGQVLEGLQLREDKGIIPPRFVIERVLDEMQAFVATPVTDNILYQALARKLADTKVPTASQDALLTEAETTISGQVYPAYQHLIDYFAKLKDKAGTDDGLWHLPDGDKAYAQALRIYTTTDMSADEIHQLGLSEVARIQGEILAILAAEGRDVSQGFTAAMDQLSADPRFYYPDTDAGRAQILADYQTILDEVSAGLDQAFRIRPKAGMEVVRIPQFKEKTAPGAYYEQPSLDGSRPGRFYANLFDIKATPRFGMRTLAYHEGIPGHHFQIALAMEQDSMPFFRRMSPFTAYTEGWALYAEYLAWELGFEKDPYDNIGRLVAELFRAVRLVVDTGIHHKHWTREAAIAYMKDNTGMAESDVVAEIERYIVMPGQATAYKVGMMKILSLREKAKAALGDKFDLRDYHDLVLKNGAVPLDVLEQLVDRYIAEHQA
ncbi:DUF885 domain-containing protein [Gallaecimonas xiamenensis]|uniref:Lipoprotein n=1 Tax=Gallaecimonas xiamenensis 3-C-1 TaxID=745411 RepID=K2J4B1_9GAMM|nr:DUF885 domain-containing protein [Gallaecimonas xiamenensis]EKE77886.1 hypothetical protein B3C1_00460 [Gallaecimonas xiamenensis 3-C-1]